MAKPHHLLLAQSLSRAKEIAETNVIRVRDLPRIDRERLEADGWLTRIIRGWYLLRQPIAKEGESTQWYSSFWDFITIYLNSRFGKNYCLSASASIDLYVGCTIIPKQLLVMVKAGGSSVVPLRFDTSIIIYQEKKTFPKVIDQAIK